MKPLRVAVVMPPVTDLAHGAALDLWPTFTKALEALTVAGQIAPTGFCRTSGGPAVEVRNGVDYLFDTDDRHLARRVADLHPDVVHIHGLGFTRLLVAIRRSIGGAVPILMQHHGEPPPGSLRSRVAQRITRRVVDGYLFTGGKVQAEPFVRAGVISEQARVYEVLESASHLDDSDDAALPPLSGSPCVLWVGRLIPSKDPVCAVRAMAVAHGLGSAAELHMLATDRSLETEVRAAIDAHGVGDVVHLHPPVAHQAMAGWYRRADMYLSTSHREGSNYSLIEALGFGCAPVVTEIPSHAAIVKELASRFAVGDADAAGVLVARPASRSAKEIAEYSSRCLSWKAVAQQLVAVYGQTHRT